MAIHDGGIPSVQRVGIATGEGPAFVARWPELKRAQEWSRQRVAEERREESQQKLLKERQQQQDVSQLMGMMANDEPFWRGHQKYRDEIEGQRADLFSYVKENMDALESGDRGVMLEAMDRVNKLRVSAATTLERKQKAMNALDMLRSNTGKFSDERAGIIKSIAGGEMTVEEAEVIDPSFDWPDLVHLSEFEELFYKSHQDLITESEEMTGEVRNQHAITQKGVNANKYADQFVEYMMSTAENRRSAQEFFIQNGVLGEDIGNPAAIEAALRDYALNRRTPESATGVRKMTVFKDGGKDEVDEPEVMPTADRIAQAAQLAAQGNTDMLSQLMPLKYQPQVVGTGIEFGKKTKAVKDDGSQTTTIRDAMFSTGMDASEIESKIREFYGIEDRPESTYVPTIEGEPVDDVRARINTILDQDKAPSDEDLKYLEKVLGTSFKKKWSIFKPTTWANWNPNVSMGSIPAKDWQKVAKALRGEVPAILKSKMKLESGQGIDLSQDF